jgi:glycosyltransferase involved in cell wall biosynthesis
MKLLVYSPISLRFGGGFEHWIIEAARHLKDLGISTEIICTESMVGDKERIPFETLCEKLKRASIDYLEIPYVPFSLFGSNSPFPSIAGLRQVLTKRDYDMLYFPNAYAFQDLLVVALKITHDRPAISGQHAVLFQESKLHNLYVNTITKSLSRHFTAWHVLNSKDMQLLKKWGVPKVYLIPIGIDTNRFRPKESEETRARFRVLFVGRLVPQKGVDTFCESIRIINQDTVLARKLEFTVVGSGPMAFMVRHISSQYENVHYFNSVSDEYLPEIYRSSDILVMPSRRETFGIVALEAQGSGLPVIATNIPGPADILVPGVTAKLIHPNDPTQLTFAVREYYDLWSGDYEEFKEACRISRKNAVERFDWNIVVESISDMLLNTYNDFMDRR